MNLTGYLRYDAEKMRMVVITDYTCSRAAKNFSVLKGQERVAGGISCAEEIVKKRQSSPKYRRPRASHFRTRCLYKGIPGWLG